jgi:hypothetical protein
MSTPHWLARLSLCATMVCSALPQPAGAFKELCRSARERAAAQLQWHRRWVPSHDPSSAVCRLPSTVYLPASCARAIVRPLPVGVADGQHDAMPPSHPRSPCPSAPVGETCRALAPRAIAIRETHWLLDLHSRLMPRAPEDHGHQSG